MQQATEHKAAQVMAAVWTAPHLDCVTSAQPHKQLNDVMIWVDWDQQSCRVSDSKSQAIQASGCFTVVPAAGPRASGRGQTKFRNLLSADFG